MIQRKGNHTDDYTCIAKLFVLSAANETPVNTLDFKLLGKLYVINTEETTFVDFTGNFRKMEHYCPLAQERI